MPLPPSQKALLRLPTLSLVQNTSLPFPSSSVCLYACVYLRWGQGSRGKGTLEVRSS